MRTSSLETVIEGLLPRTHLDNSDELLLDLGLAVKQREEGAEVLSDELRLVLSGSVERSQRNLADALKGGMHGLWSVEGED